MLPNISLFGHLGGLLAGFMLLSSLGSGITLPSHPCFEYIEANLLPSKLTRLSSYKALTNRDIVHPSLRATCSAQGIYSATSTVLGVLWYIIYTGSVLVGNVLYTLGYMAGCPVESLYTRSMQCLHSAHHVYHQYIVLSASSALTYIYSGVCSAAALFMPRRQQQEYELLPLQSEHGPNSSPPTAYDIEGSAPK